MSTVSTVHVYHLMCIAGCQTAINRFHKCQQCTKPVSLLHILGCLCKLH